MKIYHINEDYEVDLIEEEEEEKSLIICNQDNFLSIYNKFKIIRKNENDIASFVDGTHFESHIDYDVLSFSFFEWINETVVFEKVYLYFSENYFIFVCNENDFLLNNILKEVELDKDSQPNGIDTLTYIYHKTLDYIFSQMFISMDKIEQYLVDYEALIIENTEEDIFETIVAIKNMTFDIKRHLRLLMYITDQIMANDNELLKEEYLKYFKNISIKTDRLFDFGASIHEKSDHLMDMYNTMVSDRSNAFLNKLTIVTVFITPITALTGLYGMNFTNMPELNYRYSYFILLGVIASIVLVIYSYLKRNKML